MGCYPIFTCKDWRLVERDMEELGERFVSVTAVADPFGAFDESILLNGFPDLMRPYKAHYVVDLLQDPREFVSDHHQRNARRALDRMEVEICREPSRFLGEWLVLYENLIKRHAIKGIATFSENSFAHQLGAPGLTMFRASHEGASLGINLWYTQGERAYYHLGAYCNAGYEISCSYGLFWTAIQHFGQAGLRWLGLGAGVGVYGGDGSDGLTRFKEGWATETRMAYLCGRVCNPDLYRRLTARFGASANDFFPAYRRPGN